MRIRFKLDVNRGGFHWRSGQVYDVPDKVAQLLTHNGSAVPFTAEPETAAVEPRQETATRKRGRPRKVKPDEQSTE